MNKKHIIEVLQEYEKIQSVSQSKQKQRELEIYTKLPKIKEIDSIISHSGFEIAEAIFKGINTDQFIDEKRKKITELKVEKIELLVTNGYPVDYLELHYHCNKCKDTGYVETERCSCFRQKLINKYYQISNLKDVLQDENFDTFNLNLYSKEKFKNADLSPRKNMENIFTHAITFVQDFDKANENLFFYGTCGIGKTFLSNCIAKDLLDKGKVVLYQTTSNLLELLRSVRFNEDAPKDILFDVGDCDLLIMDDLGTEPTTSFSHTEIFNIINTRILNGKSTIISTNYSVEELTRNYPDRIASRILGNFAMFNFYGDDIRIKNNIDKRKKRNNV